MSNINTNQKSLVLIKPDGVERGLVGEIISRFERVGLKMVEMRLVYVTEELAYQHYADDQGWYESVGNRLLKFFEENKQDAKAEMGTDEAVEIGKMVRDWLAKYIVPGPVVAIAWEGPHAIEIIRKLTGSTYPLSASPGTIRGDYSVESPFLANIGKRAIQNLIHASDAPETAEREIKLWFPDHK